MTAIALNFGSGGSWNREMLYERIYGSDGLPVELFLSPSEGNDALVLHVHGYGGEPLSNSFVREVHSVLPSMGFDVASLQGRYTGYLRENYAESGVAYVGSAVADYADYDVDLSAAVEHLEQRYNEVILLGHSFGTNFVRQFNIDTHRIGRSIFLSPSDSA